LLKRLREEAETFKSKGNEQFKAGHYRESAESYTLALRTCPLSFDKDRAVMYSNRAAAKVKQVSFLGAIPAPPSPYTHLHGVVLFFIIIILFINNQN
jgi:hypothetical protein